MERNQQIENEYRNVLGFRSLMDSYKDQVATLETKNNELLREKNKMDYEIQRMVKKVDLLELDKARDSERILALEDHLQDLQLGGGRRVTAGADRKKDTDAMDLDVYGDDVMADDDDDDDDVHLGGSLEDSLTENNVVELKRSNRRLERQVRALQQEGGSTTDSNQNMVVLQHLLDDSNRLKAQFEKNYLDVSQERDILQSDMARVRQGIPDSLLDESSSTMSARLNIIDLEKENRKLRDEKAKLEQKVKDVRSTFGKDGIDTLDGLDDFKAQYKQMEQKALLLEQQTKKQLQDINKLLLEKDMLQSQSIDQKDLLLDKERLYSEMKASLAVFEAQEDEPLKQQNAQLQQRTIKQQEQLRELQLKLKKTKEFVIQQDKMLKESKLNGTSGNYDEAVSSLKSELALRDEENDRLKPSNKSFITKVKLGKAQKQNRPLPHWFRLKSDTKIRWNAKRRNWRHTKLNI
ncbi:hypothetical protein [Absidia glauca]|uniref:Large ribosomal subunit protein eL39 n=1 Tax=Absidia glauca TaxID=4829 RepID=A0A168N7L4_ABSGL|nr:hypothetical protein [Absidia glauca]